MRYKYFDLIMALFVTVLLVSNIASSAKIVDWGVSLLGLPLAFDAGTLLFPISYIFGDVLTEVYGYRRRSRGTCAIPLRSESRRVGGTVAIPPAMATRMPDFERLHASLVPGNEGRKQAPRDVGCLWCAGPGQLAAAI